MSDREEHTEERAETHACDLISRRAAIDAICEDGTQLERQGQYSMTMAERKQRDADILDALPSAQKELIRCKDCKHNPKHEWFGCPMSHLSEKQRPDTAWCWKAERRTDD